MEALVERIGPKINSVISNREDRQPFWSSIMNDENQELRDRPRASELLAKSERDFIDQNQSSQVPTIEDLISASRQAERNELNVPD